MTNQNLYEQELWDEGYQDYYFFIAGDADPVKQFLLEHLPMETGACFEVGCFPGRYLAVLGQKGWELHGLDLTPHLPDMVNWLKQQRFKTGNFSIKKFEDNEDGKQYDLVYSCGFVEHFTNYGEIIRLHASMVKKNGTIIITTPNFNGVQGFLHRTMDSLNYSRHNVKSMNIKQWSKILTEEGFTVEKSTYFGRFAFWHGAQSRPYYIRFVLYRFMKIVPFLSRIIKFDSCSLSPFCGIVATKN